LLFHGSCYFLNNTIPGTPLPENFGTNERWAGLKTGFLLSGISKTLCLATNPAY
jgi:hypothetical protein